MHIEILLNEFKINLQKVQEKYENTKRIADGLKMINEEKLSQQEFEQDKETADQKDKQDNEKYEMEGVISELKKDNETLKWQEDRLNKEILEHTKTIQREQNFCQQLNIQI